jgi:hypothetical protein
MQASVFGDRGFFIDPATRLLAFELRLVSVHSW